MVYPLIYIDDILLFLQCVVYKSQGICVQNKKVYMISQEEEEEKQLSSLFIQKGREAIKSTERLDGNERSGQQEDCHPRYAHLHTHK